MTLRSLTQMRPNQTGGASQASREPPDRVSLLNLLTRLRLDYNLALRTKTRRASRGRTNRTRTDSVSVVEIVSGDTKSTRNEGSPFGPEAVLVTLVLTRLQATVGGPATNVPAHWPFGHSTDARKVCDTDDRTLKMRWRSF